MIKLDRSSISLTYPSNSVAHLETVRHLVVLVPANADCSAATRRIWELAHTTSMQVRLLSLCTDTAEESNLRRELITRASLLQDGKISVEAKVEIGTNWLDVVKNNYKAGDMIVCFAEQRTGLLRKPLSQILEANFDATVYILADNAPQKPKINRLSQMSAWLGSIVIIIGFGLLQAKIVQMPEGWLQNVLLILSIIPEFWLIWVWFG
ncbi:MAG: hypothetical protein JW730_16980 [Anaerolineales bacterium]|nr:hypothetical protein [Anaerolineales bacterium]